MRTKLICNGPVFESSRCRLSWDQEFLASRAGLSKRTIQRYEASDPTDPDTWHPGRGREFNQIVQALEKGFKEKGLTDFPRATFAFTASTNNVVEPISTDIFDPLNMIKEKLTIDLNHVTSRSREESVKINCQSTNRLTILHKVRDFSVGDRMPLSENLYCAEDKIDASGYINTPPDQPPRDEDRDNFKNVLAHFENTHVVVNNQCIVVAPIAAFLSLNKRFGLQYRLRFEHTSGVQQIFDLNVDDDSDFVITAQAPFLLAGNAKTMGYQRIMPINVEEQFLLEMRPVESEKYYSWPNPLVLVYNNSSALEQVIVEYGNEEKYGPRIVLKIDTLEELVERSIQLHTGDQVIAWDPLASGLQHLNRSMVRTGHMKNMLERTGHVYDLQICLYCRKEWQDGQKLSIKESLKKWLSLELAYLRKHRRWAENVLLEDHDDVGFKVDKFVQRFTIGAGCAKILESEEH